MKIADDILNGKSVIDKNSNYEHNIANIRRQIQAEAETIFNRALILEKFDRSDEILKLHDNELCIHDLSKLILLPYCYSYSLLPLVLEGITYNKQFSSRPAKRLTSFAIHCREFFSHVAIRTRGACAFPDIFVCMTYFIKKFGLLNNIHEEFAEGQTKEEFLGNILQQLFYSVNQNLREGSESMFTNMSFFDRDYCKSLFSTYWSVLDISVDDVIEFQKFVMKWHTNEVMNVKMLRWPVITISFLKDKQHKIVDKDFLKFVCKQNVQHNMYNFLVLDSVASLASCCRLINDGSHPFLNSYGSGSISIGSHQVVSLNLPHIYLKYKHKHEERIKYLCKLIMEFQDWHRDLLKQYDYLDEMYEHNIRNIDRMFSTFGIIGLVDYKEVRGISWDELAIFTKKLSDHINSFGRFTNLELVPAESAAVELFKSDAATFPAESYYEIQSLYSNQIVSPWIDVDLPERMKITGQIANMMSGGSMAFITTMDRVQHPAAMESIIRGVAKSQVPYFCFDTYISACSNDHQVSGSYETCPLCGAPIVHKYRRVVGYFVEIDFMYDRKKIDVPRRV